MRILVFLTVATIKCSGRSLLDHSQSLNPDNIQDEGSSSSPLLKPRSLSESHMESTTTSTTLDPWAEFCKEACKDGWAGPECDCPDHGIIQGVDGNFGHMKSNENTHTKSYNKIQSFLNALHKLILKRKVTYTEDIKRKSSPSIEKTHLNSNKNVPKSKSTSTTLDPWDEFCKEACKEGLAGPECDCPEHPIG